MKIAGVWLLVLGYTLVYVGWNNLSGSRISFLDAISGKPPGPGGSSPLVSTQTAKTSSVATAPTTPTSGVMQYGT